ncbi:efflux RND transporter periplasmic adaptor subunit [Methyloversatilis discipulorum]|uniref:efflux RND transporter periplasmic adaptor subunit n=1 Tax=Methyloversatilis discipulorum TaxID=1119528 RepID=UPI001A3C4F07|nr:efflux RND transporter periplasmic adaptor subunit [Methyloversatilis discipulorum]MBL8467748.1 efflux RND transporter periplasmic adaptor subunit [Methyloversatilis discipulorum]
MNDLQKKSGWPLIAGTALFAAGIGFGVAKLVAPPQQPAEALPEQIERKPVPRKEAVALKIPAEYLKIAGIGVEQLQVGSVAAEILAPATVAAPPGSEAVIVARANGVLSRINKRLGDTVKAGETLATVESMQAASMVSDTRVAAARLDAARRAYERERSLFDQGVTPRQDMESAKAVLDVASAEASRANSVAHAARVTGDGQAIAVVSPIAGRITAQSTVLGGSVTTDVELFRVADTKNVQIEASVTAEDSRRVAPGDEASITTRSGTPLQARVHAVTPTVTGGARTATVVLLPQGDVEGLVVGEGVQARLHLKGGENNGFKVSEDAVQRIEGRDSLFVLEEDGFRIVPVLVGVRSNGVAQIISGVKGNERVATRNAFLLKAEMRKAAGDDE